MSRFVITAVEAEQGDVTVNEDGTLSYTVPAEFSGDTITCTIQGEIVINSLPADQPPVTGPDEATVMAGGSVTIDVLGNDADPEGKALTVTGATADHGRVTVNTDSTLSYAAPIHFFGSTTITYTVADPAGNASDGTVSVDVKAYVPPDLPPIVGADKATVVAGGAVVIDVLDNDADPEGKALTVTAATADRGTVSITPESMLFYTSSADASGPATITYTAADPAGNESKGMVTVEILILSIAEGEIEGEFVVSSAPGELTITILEPAECAGEYILKTADLAAGPVALVPPRISGTAEAGATLTAVPGLWASDEAAAPLTITRQWFRGATAITGATGASYVVDATADAGQTLSVVETVATPTGTAESESAGIDIPKGIEEGWTPAGLAALAAWFDASDAGAVILSDGKVTKLVDKSGNGCDAAQVAGSPVPALEAELAGKPVLRFPTGGVLRTPASLPGLPGMPGITTISVTQAHIPENFKECFSFRNDAIADGQHLTVQTGFSMMWFGNGNRYWNQPAYGPVISVAHYPENGTHEQTEWWRDGTRLSPTSTARSGASVSLPTDAYLQIGNQDSPTSEQAECLFLVGPLSDEDRHKAEGYLAHKWGLAGQLPDTHPYKAGPPN